MLSKADDPLELDKLWLKMLGQDAAIRHYIKSTASQEARIDELEEQENELQRRGLSFLLEKIELEKVNSRLSTTVEALQNVKQRLQDENAELTDRTSSARRQIWSLAIGLARSNSKKEKLEGDIEKLKSDHESVTNSHRQVSSTILGVLPLML
jgi:predicted  nucleic acid-binding Zn-ribbon protein